MEEETEYEQSQQYACAWYPRHWRDAEEERLWDDFCASVTDGCDDEG